MTMTSQPELDFLPIAGETLAVVDSVANDWRADGDWLRFVEACAASADVAGVVHVGDVRRRLTNEHGLTIAPRRLSAFWARAASKAGFLMVDGWEISDDVRGRNAGRPARRYRYRSAA